MATYAKRYTHFVVDSRGNIHSAWENASDARDAARDPGEFGPAPVVGCTYRVYTRAALLRMGFDLVVRS